MKFFTVTNGLERHEHEIGITDAILNQRLENGFCDGDSLILESPSNDDVLKNCIISLYIYDKIIHIMTDPELISDNYINHHTDNEIEWEEQIDFECNIELGKNEGQVFRKWCDENNL